MINLYKAISLAAALCFSSSIQASSLGFGSITQTGQQLNVELAISGLGDGMADSLSTYDLDILFDSSHLAYVSSSFGDSELGNQLDLFGFGDNFAFSGTVVTGVLNVYEESFDLAEDLNNLQASSFNLATIAFDILKSDISQLQLLVNALGDANGNSLSATLNTATVTTVPVPAAFWLMASGLVALYRKKHCDFR